MFSRAIAIARKEVRELLRDPIYLGLAFVVPITLMLLLGYGLSMDVKHLPIVFVDQDRTPISRGYIDGERNHPPSLRAPPARPPTICG